ncbi:MFS transporter [Streptomyces chryseus]|uniref:MFS transporter n=1 Tax=Streptomyces chryseus TaxID=68186 RepID=UPI001E3E8BA3|nr:MFS transporter [Streptomyces chryseus]
MTSTDTGVIRTRIPARLDRLPWSPWHWRIVIGLGTVWVLDGLEVTIVGNIVGRLAEEGSGIDITTAQVTTWAAALYVAGACVGALFFGRLTDLYGRKKLFMITLAVHLAATAATALGLSLFIGQAFLYNSITFGYAVILTEFFDVPVGSTAYYFAVIAVGNLLGPLVLGHFFDSVGRAPMIAGTYTVSGLLLFGTAYLFQQGSLSAVTLTACWCAVLFFASAGASSAYLTVSEIFPLETRAMCVCPAALQRRARSRRRAGPSARPLDVTPDQGFARACSSTPSGSVNAQVREVSSLSSSCSQEIGAATGAPSPGRSDQGATAVCA